MKVSLVMLGVLLALSGPPGFAADKSGAADDTALTVPLSAVRAAEGGRRTPSPAGRW